MSDVIDRKQEEPKDRTLREPGYRIYGKAIVMILIAFAIGLVFFFAFASELGDGLERTMEEGSAEESSDYEAPMDYGDGYAGAFLAGLIGFLVVLAMIVGYGRTRNSGERPNAP